MQRGVSIVRGDTHAIYPILLNKYGSNFKLVKLDCYHQSAPKFNAGSIVIDVELKSFYQELNEYLMLIFDSQYQRSHTIIVSNVNVDLLS